MKKLASTQWGADQTAEEAVCWEDQTGPRTIIPGIENKGTQSDPERSLTVEYIQTAEMGEEEYLQDTKRKKC